MDTDDRYAAPARPDAQVGMTPNEAIDVSVVIPCLDEAHSIAFCIDKAIAAFRDAGIRGEVVVSDNGSTDGSIDIASTHGARVVHAPLKGYGHALRKGIDAVYGSSNPVQRFMGQCSFGNPRGTGNAPQ